jgi:pilus assembly protein CpaE
MVLQTIIISPDQALSGNLERALSAITDIRVGRVLTEYPSYNELSHTLRSQAPDIVFLSFQIGALARNVAELIATAAPGVKIVGIHHEFDAAILRETMRCGLQDFVSYPFEPEPLMECLIHLKDLLERNPVRPKDASQVFSFLPAKAGVGASTLAVNVSGALARSNTRVLLSDFDLDSGILHFLLNLKGGRSVADALEHVYDLDEQLWRQVPVSRGKLDLLQAGTNNPDVRIEPAQLLHLLAFIRRNYPVLCFDLSDRLDRRAIAILEESTRIVLVSTTESASLHLARQKLQALRRYDLHGRTCVVLNRVTRNEVLTLSNVEELLGMPVTESFPNNYSAVKRAIAAGDCLEASSDLGKRFTQFANSLLVPEGSSGQPQAKRSFLDLVSLSPKTFTALIRSNRFAGTSSV